MTFDDDPDVKCVVVIRCPQTGQAVVQLGTINRCW